MVRQMSKRSDVLIDPYRPGVMEKLGLGPEKLLADNPRLIYARLSGFGQTGPLAKRAGHDINYVAMSGMLSFIGRKGEKPLPPVNLLADFAGGGLLTAFGILAALQSRHNTGEGQVLDCSMTEGAAYVGSWLTRTQDMPVLWGNARGENLLDSGKFFYDTYETQDGKYMSVGCLEQKFFDVFTEKLGLSDVEEFNQFMDNEKGKAIVESKFKAKTQEEWNKIFENTDACVYPVLHWSEAPDHRHNKMRGSFGREGNCVIPNPSPKLSKTPAVSVSQKEKVDPWLEMQTILGELGKNVDDIKKLVEDGVVLTTATSKL